MSNQTITCNFCGSEWETMFEKGNDRTAWLVLMRCPLCQEFAPEIEQEPEKKA